MIATGVILLLMTMQLPDTESQLFDSRFVPLITSLIMIAMGIPQLIKNYGKEQGENRKNDNKTLLITIILLVFYVLLYRRLGFVITSTIFLFFEIINLTPSYIKKNYVLNLIIAIASPVMVYYLFYYGFKTILPVGILRGIL